MISKEDLQNLYKKFLSANTIFPNKGDVDGYLEQWGRQSMEFKEFWRSRIMPGASDLSDEEINRIIRYLDCHIPGISKADRNGCYHVARCSGHDVPWHELFRGIFVNQKVKESLNDVFNNTDEQSIISSIDNLNQINASKIDKVKWLTGKDAVCLNAMMCLNNPSGVVSSVNLVDDRYKIIEYFEFADPSEWATYGEALVKSNQAILRGFAEQFDLRVPAILLSLFYYECSSELGWQGHIVKSKFVSGKPKKAKKENKFHCVFKN